MPYIDRPHLRANELAWPQEQREFKNYSAVSPRLASVVSLSLHRSIMSSF